MPGRGLQLAGYRFGFQNQEEDAEFWGGAVAYKYRIEDKRVGRFFSVDPLAREYPFFSSYSFSGNRVLDAVELEGLEPVPSARPASPGRRGRVLPLYPNPPPPPQRLGMPHAEIFEGGARYIEEPSPLPNFNSEEERLKFTESQLLSRGALKPENAAFHSYEEAWSLASQSNFSSAVRDLNRIATAFERVASGIANDEDFNIVNAERAGIQKEDWRKTKQRIVYFYIHPESGKLYVGKTTLGFNNRYAGSQNPFYPEIKANGVIDVIENVPFEVELGVLEQIMIDLNGGYKSHNLHNRDNSVNSQTMEGKRPAAVKWLNNNYPGWEHRFKLQE